MDAAQFQKDIRIVEWEDSAGRGGWRVIEKLAADTPTIATSIGYVIRDDDRGITLLQTHAIEEGEEPIGEGTMIIPRSAIRAVRTVRVEEGG